jgi:hypothetical protein
LESSIAEQGVIRCQPGGNVFSADEHWLTSYAVQCSSMATFAVALYFNDIK